MRIYFENYPYPASEVDKYFGKVKLFTNEKNDMRKTSYIGYIFLDTDTYNGPVFILPKTFLHKEGNRLNVLGMKGFYPEKVIDTDSEDNPFELNGQSFFLPELGLWQYRALNRFRFEHEGTEIAEQAYLDTQLPEDGARDKDFLATALELIDFLKSHQTLFTQISIINHSGRDKTDWPKTVRGETYIHKGEPWYLKPAVKEKTIDIDDTLIVLYYSVLLYLRDKYHFPVRLGEIPYNNLLSVYEVQRYLDTGIGSKQLHRIRHRYYRDELKQLWALLDAFFTYNTSDKDKDQRKEYLLVRNFEAVFESMIDSLISDTRGVEDLKKQDDGKLIDHIFRHTSLVGGKSDIYYIGDSKYYAEGHHPTGVALYKQFTYAKNAIQYHIDNLYLYKTTSKGKLRYRDTLTEGYNITPNFFIRSRVPRYDVSFDTPELLPTHWKNKKGQEFPPTNKHFEDRLFDRDTLILREFSINLLFVIAAYAGYEDKDWTSAFHTAIREEFIKSIDKAYNFFILTPEKVTTLTFCHVYSYLLNGRIYTLDESDGYLIVAFEKTPRGDQDFHKLKNTKLYSQETREPLEFTLEQTTLAQLSHIQ